ncbi:MAG TPA: pilin [Piscinibacter sp.]|nr:pilin [Piscinibacter sp.]
MKRGFTLIEVLMVLAVIAILATLAMPSLQDRIVRDQIVEAMKLADVAKPNVAAIWKLTHALPADNAAAGLPAADRIVGNLVSAVTVEQGAVHVTFGNQANGAIKGKTLTLRPAVVEDAPVVPVAWVCAGASAPAPMTVHGTDRSSVAARFLPLNCR